MEGRSRDFSLPECKIVVGEYPRDNISCRFLKKTNPTVQLYHRANIAVCAGISIRPRVINDSRMFFT